MSSLAQQTAQQSTKRFYAKWQFWLITFVTIIVILGLFLYGLMGLVDKSATKNGVKMTQPHQLAYLSIPAVPKGKILAVVTSTARMGNTDKSTGYELTELARAYYVFQANGFEVDIASPLGGEPPVVIDNDDMGPFDYAFLNDQNAQQKVINSLALNSIEPNDYKAVYFVGGKGTMFDFPNNPDIANIVKQIYENNGVIGAVCHGPAALVNVTLSNGESILNKRTVTSFTNTEELFLIPEAETIFPFLLESELVKAGATFEKAQDYMEQVSVDGKVVTGQNPWSVWKTAEAIIMQLGIQARPREITDEEHSIALLMTFKDQGYDAAAAYLKALTQQQKPIKRNLVLMHAIVAGMQFEIRDTLNLIILTRSIKRYQELSK